MLCLVMGSNAFADGTSAKNLRKVSSGVAVCDGADGWCTDVDSSGRMEVKDVAAGGSIKNVQEGDEIAITGAAKVYSITVTGATAGDTALLYDALSATGFPIFDIKVGTNNSTVSVPLGKNGVAVSTGLYVDVTDADVDVAVVYE